MPGKSIHSITHRQSGMTLWSLLYVLVTLGVIVFVLIESVPVYLNAHDIGNAVHWAANKPDLQQASAPEIQRAIQKRFGAGYVSNVSGRDVAVKSVHGQRLLEIQYEVRKSFLFNTSLVYSFDKKARMGADDSG